MIGTIGAAVSGARKVRQVAVYFTSVLCAATAVGIALGFAGSLMSQRWAAALGLTLLCVPVASYLSVGRMPRFPFPRQMPRRWIDTTHPAFTAARFGSVFGLHYATPIRAGATLALAGMAVTLGNPWLGGTSFAIAGVVRALPASVLPFVGEIHDRQYDLFDAIMRRQSLVSQLDLISCVVALAAFAALFVA